jgi:hypothetical protein
MNQPFMASRCFRNELSRVTSAFAERMARGASRFLTAFLAWPAAGIIGRVGVAVVARSTGCIPIGPTVFLFLLMPE